MNFQQQVAVFLSITVATDRGAESFVLLSLNWLFLAVWTVVTLPTRWAARLALGWAAGRAALDTMLTSVLFGRQAVWAIG